MAIIKAIEPDFQNLDVHNTNETFDHYAICFSETNFFTRILLKQ